MTLDKGCDLKRTMIMRKAAALLLLTSSLLAYPAAANERFDYLALVLSWSPSYCASVAGSRDTHQCNSGRRYAFVVHGLWPQRQVGWPEYCDSDERYVPDQIIDGMLDIMPSKRLVIHEWKKHGTCSRLSQWGYFAATRTLFNKIKIPARYLSPQSMVSISPNELISDFVKTNSWLKPGMMSVHCGNRRDRANLRDVRFCFDLSGKPRNCGRNEARSCRAKQLLMPPAR